MKKISDRKRTRSCGNVLGESDAPSVIMLSPSGRASFDNVETCDSNWTCLVCASRKAAIRARKLKHFLRDQKRAGRYVITVNLTLRHNKSMRLDPLWTTVQESVNYVTKGGSWSNISRTFGITHFVKVIEVTHGPNGWHPHVHMVLVIDPGAATNHDLHDLEFKVWQRWLAAVEDHGYQSDWNDGGIKITTEGDTDRLAEYLEKGHRLKSEEIDELSLSEQTSLMPFEIGLLASSAEIPDDIRLKYLRLWHEWEAASLSRPKAKTLRRPMWWSFNLNAVLSEIAPDPDDDGRPATYDDMSMRDVDHVLPKKAPALLPHRKASTLGIALFEVIENEGVEAAKAWMDHLGFAYDLPPLPQSGEPLYGDWIVMEDGTRVLTGRIPHPSAKTYTEAEVLVPRRKIRRGSEEWHERRRLKRGM